MYNVVMSSSLVSIVIPVFNTGKLARSLVDKLLSDDYRDVEIILVDDGSTDNSLEIIKQIKNEKVRIYNKKNGGPSAARNFGIKKAKGEYLLFVDSDDDMAQDYVQKMVLAFRDDIDMVVSGVKYCKLDKQNEEDVYLDEFLYKDNEGNKDFMLRSLLHDGRMYPVFNKVFRTEIIRKNEIEFDEKMSFGEDTKFVMDYVGAIKGKIKFILEPLYIYHAGTSTSTAKKLQGEWKNWQKCYDNLEEWMGNKLTWNQKRLLFLIYLKWRASWFKIRLS